MPMGEDDAGPFGRELGEGDLDLAGAVGVGLDLPLRRDVPGEAHPVRRLVLQDACPAAFAAVDAAVDDVAADERLEHHLGQGRLEDVLVLVPPRADLGGEDMERASSRGVDLDGRGHCGGIDRGHGVSSMRWTTRSKEASDRFQNESK